MTTNTTDAPIDSIPSRLNGKDVLMKLILGKEAIVIVANGDTCITARWNRSCADGWWQGHYGLTYPEAIKNAAERALIVIGDRT